ncbi:MAG: flippase-like domain-containing protein, partial [Desulfobacteraceae bacterium]|nr:flippase-like domain-containing protein [Desulfobacteraceae bacterium]
LCLSFPGARWHWLLKAAGLGFGLGEACRLNWIGIFFSMAMPGTTGGDVVKTYYAMKRTESKSLPVLTIVMDRVLGCIALVLLALGALLLNVETHRILNWKVLAAVPVFLLGAAFLFPIFWKYARRLPVLQRPSLSGHLDQVEHALGLYRTQKAMLLFWVGMSLVNHAAFALSVGVLGRAMGFDASFGNYLTIVPVVNLGSAFSITPAGWGVGEALFDLLFVKFAGQAPGSGAGVAVMVRAMALFPFFVGGFLYMCARREYSRQASVETSC